MASDNTPDFVGHDRLPYDAASMAAIDNIIMPSPMPGLEWASKSTQAIGPWRARLRSTYIGWALSINGLHEAATRYAGPEYASRPSQFTVSALRLRADGSAGPAVIAQWEWPEASENHLRAQGKMAIWGLVDLYSAFEECVFEFALAYYIQHPDKLITGPEFQEARRLRRQAGDSQEAMQAWLTARDSRLATWQRNRLYDGLDKVLVTYFEHAGLRKPKGYATGPTDWAANLRIYAQIRNHLVHGARVVNDALAAESAGTPLAFSVGAPLEISLEHLQSFELYTAQLLTALNLALVQLLQASY